jgi:hypothetical protein
MGVPCLKRVFHPCCLAACFSLAGCFGLDGRLRRNITGRSLVWQQVSYTATPRSAPKVKKTLRGWLAVSAGFIGAGFNIVFQQCLNFLVDTYGPYAASATSANTFLRSLIACGLPLAARPMFQNMGVGPAASVLGGISCLALPVPLVFMKYGEGLRKRSKFIKTDGWNAPWA